MNKQETPGIRLEIRADNLVPMGHGVCISINGMDVTNSIQRLELRMGAGEISAATVTLLTKEIAVDIGARLLLEARLHQLTMLTEAAP